MRDVRCLRFAVHRWREEEISMNRDRELDTVDGNRRDVVRKAGAAIVVGVAASSVALPGSAAGQAAPRMSPT
jgi:hypothetical protein